MSISAPQSLWQGVGVTKKTQPSGNLFFAAHGETANEKRRYKTKPGETEPSFHVMPVCKGANSDKPSKTDTTLRRRNTLLKTSVWTPRKNSARGWSILLTWVVRRDLQWTNSMTSYRRTCLLIKWSATILLTNQCFD
jgi:hypothetical protein